MFARDGTYVNPAVDERQDHQESCTISRDRRQAAALRAAVAAAAQRRELDMIRTGAWADQGSLDNVRTDAWRR
ncbi:MAG: hypothetical protein QOE97_811 [Pseudonocardiales bacterium]|jgi:hypothetical protein|nr:hypothetical protein [Pseudonocardiales bacterium]